MLTINKFLFESKIRKYIFKRFIHKKKSLDKYSNLLKEYNLGIGDWEPSNKSSISAAKVPTKRLMDLLESKKVPVTIIDEYNTSKNCANCFEQLKTYDPVKKRKMDKTWYSKLRHCVKCGHIVHRDQNASRNIKMIFECSLNGEEKPKQFLNTFKEFERIIY